MIYFQAIFIVFFALVLRRTRWRTCLRFSTSPPASPSSTSFHRHPKQCQSNTKRNEESNKCQLCSPTPLKMGVTSHQWGLIMIIPTIDNYFDPFHISFNHVVLEAFLDLSDFCAESPQSLFRTCSKSWGIPQNSLLSNFINTHNMQRQILRDSVIFAISYGTVWLFSIALVRLFCGCWHWTCNRE